MNSDILKLYIINHWKPLDGFMSDYFKSKELYTLEIPSIRLLLYIASTLKSKRLDYINSQIIELKPNIAGISRNGFFSAVKELTDLNIISKIKPHVFIVNPGYHCVMTTEQLKRFNFDLECELLDINFNSL